MKLIQRFIFVRDKMSRPTWDSDIQVENIREEVMEALRTALEWATIGVYDDVYITMKKGKSSVTISADPRE